MRVRFSRWMAVAVTAVSVAAISSTGCSTMSHMPGSSLVTGWWHKAPTESYASRTPRPSSQSEPSVTVTQGNASAGPTDIANTPYGGANSYGSAQPSGGYPTQPAGAIQPNYATGGNSNPSSGNTYADVAARHGYQAGASTQVKPAANQYGGNSPSVYGNASAPASPYGNPYAGGAAAQTADARNTDWGNSGPAGASAASSNAYGAQPAGNSSIQPYAGGQSGAQPYGNPTPPPSYTPAAPPAGGYGSGGYGAGNSNAGGYGSGGYSANTTPAPSAPMSQPSADGYSPFGTSSYAERQEPAPINDAAELYSGSEVEPAAYQQGASASNGGYQAAPSSNYGAGGAYGGSQPSSGGYQQPSSQPLY